MATQADKEKGLKPKKQPGQKRKRQSKKPYQLPISNMNASLPLVQSLIHSARGLFKVSTKKEVRFAQALKDCEEDLEKLHTIMNEPDDKSEGEVETKNQKPPQNFKQPDETPNFGRNYPSIIDSLDQVIKKHRNGTSECRRVYLCLHDSNKVLDGAIFKQVSSKLSGRNPFHKDETLINYDCDSEDEMQEILADSISMSKNRNESDQSDKESKQSLSGIVSDGHFSRFELPSDDEFNKSRRTKPNQQKLSEEFQPYRLMSGPQLDEYSITNISPSEYPLPIKKSVQKQQKQQRKRLEEQPTPKDQLKPQLQPIQQQQVQIQSQDKEQSFPKDQNIIIFIESSESQSESEEIVLPITKRLRSDLGDLIQVNLFM